MIPGVMPQNHMPVIEETPEAGATMVQAIQPVSWRDKPMDQGEGEKRKSQSSDSWPSELIWILKLTLLCCQARKPKLVGSIYNWIPTCRFGSIYWHGCESRRVNRKAHVQRHAARSQSNILDERPKDSWLESQWFANLALLNC